MKKVIICTLIARFLFNQTSFASEEFSLITTEDHCQVRRATITDGAVWQIEDDALDCKDITNPLTIYTKTLEKNDLLISKIDCLGEGMLNLRALSAFFFGVSIYVEKPGSVYIWLTSLSHEPQILGKYLSARFDFKVCKVFQQSSPPIYSCMVLMGASLKDISKNLCLIDNL